MNPLLTEVRQNCLLWLLAVVPVLFAAEALLSRATESVAAKTPSTATSTSQDSVSKQCPFRAKGGCVKRRD